MLMLAFALLAAAPHEKVVIGEVRSFDPALKNLSLQVQEQLATELSKLSRHEILTSSDLQALLGLERQRQLLGCSEDQLSCMGEIGSALGAAWLVAASLGQGANGRVRFDVKLISTEKNAVVVRDGGDVEPAQLTSAVQRATERISEALEGASPTSSRVPVGPLVVGAAGVVIAGVGATLLGLVPGQRSALQAQVPSLTGDVATQRQSALSTQATIGTALLIAGAAVAVAGVVWWVVTPGRGAASAWLAPVPNGLALGGTW